ncbi:hypothetical protein ACHAXA_001430 [Cyclostephanos tholiformis]|uniref:Uncharacterized protein n=1 Tax=Cyclostephanos tholiformis TaxID=382380 RepID=A0ABD3RU11_9STRA
MNCRTRQAETISFGTKKQAETISVGTNKQAEATSSETKNQAKADSFVISTPERRDRDKKFGGTTYEAEESLSLGTESTTSTESRQLQRLSSDVRYILASLSDVEASSTSIDKIKGKRNGIKTTNPQIATEPATAKPTSLKKDEGRGTWKGVISGRGKGLSISQRIFGNKIHSKGKIKSVVKSKNKICSGGSSSLATADLPKTSTKASADATTRMNETLAKKTFRGLKTSARNLTEKRGMVLLSATINRVKKKASEEVQPGTTFYTVITEDCRGNGSMDATWTPECGGARISLAQTKDPDEAKSINDESLSIERSLRIVSTSLVSDESSNSILSTSEPACRAMDTDAKRGKQVQPESLASYHDDDIAERFVTIPMTMRKVSSISRISDNDDDMDSLVDEKYERQSARFNEEAEEFVYNRSKSAAAKYRRRRRRLRQPAAVYRRHSLFANDDKGFLAVQIDALNESMEAVMNSMETVLCQMSCLE